MLICLEDVMLTPGHDLYIMDYLNPILMKQDTLIGKYDILTKYEDYKDLPEEKLSSYDLILLNSWEYGYKVLED